MFKWWHACEYIPFKKYIEEILVLFSYTTSKEADNDELKFNRKKKAYLMQVEENWHLVAGIQD